MTAESPKSDRYNAREAEKWVPVFGSGHAPPNNLARYKRARGFNALHPAAEAQPGAISSIFGK
jgi:hypothetical protein